MFTSSVILTMYMDDYHTFLATGSLSTLDENFVTTMFHLSKYTFFISAALAVLLWVHTLWTECNKEETE